MEYNFKNDNMKNTRMKVKVKYNDEAQVGKVCKKRGKWVRCRVQGKRHLKEAVKEEQRQLRETHIRKEVTVNRKLIKTPNIDTLYCQPTPSPSTCIFYRV